LGADRREKKWRELYHGSVFGTYQGSYRGKDFVRDFRKVPVPKDTMEIVIGLKIKKYMILT
jgi:hypothetical protein